MLAPRVAAWNNTSKIGDIFLNVAPSFKQYFLYLFNYKIAIGKLQEVRSLNLIHLEEFLNTQRANPRCIGLDLESLLIKPAQRLMQYPLLLETLCRNTWPTHCDYKDLRKALALVKQVASTVEKQCTEADSIAAVVTIQSSLKDVPPEVQLVAPHRRFVREGTFQTVNELGKIRHTVHCFLFNDCLIYAQPLPDLFGRPQYRYLNQFVSGECEAFQPLDVPIANAIAFECIGTARRMIIDVDDAALHKQWTADLEEMAEYACIDLTRRASMQVAHTPQLDGDIATTAATEEPHDTAATTTTVHQHKEGHHQSAPACIHTSPLPDVGHDTIPVGVHLRQRRLTVFQSVGSVSPGSPASDHSSGGGIPDPIPPSELKLQRMFHLDPSERLVDSFGCLNGRLYLFQSRAVLHFGRKMHVILFADVQRLTPCRAFKLLPIQNSLLFELKSGEKRTISGFMNTDKCFDQLKKLIRRHSDCVFTETT
eukprot:TRINITY_DN1362_c0_g1_i3.p1 TRINITY_DN1362_c0_g1~~TRINITY_DN1362_c0_g1_i3.p1  ORF type:complete len:481 (+),score=89.60 TRINITY_DN1362_c0_g1_i3:364-1806(+)